MDPGRLASQATRELCARGAPLFRVPGAPKSLFFRMSGLWPLPPPTANKEPSLWFPEQPQGLVTCSASFVQGPLPPCLIPQLTSISALSSGLSSETPDQLGEVLSCLPSGPASTPFLPGLPCPLRLSPHSPLYLCSSVAVFCLWHRARLWGPDVNKKYVLSPRVGVCVTESHNCEIS